MLARVPAVRRLQTVSVFLFAPATKTCKTTARSPKQFALINAVVQVGAGVLLATGKAPRMASAALAATVFPGNLGAHLFWTEDDTERKAEKLRGFLADVSLLGALAIASADTAGRPSLGWRSRRAAERFTETVSSTLRDDSHRWLHDSELGSRLMHGLHRHPTNHA